MIALVAVTDAAAPPPPAPLRAVRAGALSALCLPATPEPVTLDLLERRETLIDSLMEDRDLLPVRFGADLPDEQAAAQVLIDRQEELRAALDRVRGAVELSVRVQPAEPGDEPSGSAASGREYLSARIASSQIAERIHGRLAGHARAATRRPGPDLMRAAYLVDRDGVADFLAEFRRVQESHPDLALLCTGPWAPFSFTTEENPS